MTLAASHEAQVHELNPTESAVLQALAARPMRARELQGVVARDPRTLYTARTALIAGGLVEVEGEGRSAVYRLTTSGCAHPDAARRHPDEHPDAHPDEGGRGEPVGSRRSSLKLFEKKDLNNNNDGTKKPHPDPDAHPDVVAARIRMFDAQADAARALAELRRAKRDRIARVAPPERVAAVPASAPVGAPIAPPERTAPKPRGIPAGVDARLDRAALALARHVQRLAESQGKPDPIGDLDAWLAGTRARLKASASALEDAERKAKAQEFQAKREADAATVREERQRKQEAEREHARRASERAAELRDARARVPEARRLELEAEADRRTRASGLRPIHNAFERTKARTLEELLAQELARPQEAAAT